MIFYPYSKNMMKFFINSIFLHFIIIGAIASHDILFSVEKTISNSAKSIKEDKSYKSEEIHNEALYSIAITEEELKSEMETIDNNLKLENDHIKKQALKEVEKEKKLLLDKIELDKKIIEDKEKELIAKENQIKSEEQKILHEKEIINKSENLLFEQKIVIQNEKNNAEELLNYIEYEKNKLNQEFNKQSKEIEDKNRILIEKNQILLKKEQEIKDLKSKLQKLVVTKDKGSDSIYKNNTDLQMETANHIELIKQKILNNWQYEPEYKGVSCKITLLQDEKGYILKVQFNECYNDIDFQNSIRKAIFASNPLPLPKNKEIFDRNISLFFKIH